MTKMVEDALNEDAYLADVAGLHYSLSQEGTAGIWTTLKASSRAL